MAIANDDYEQHSWRIPEWNAGWRDAGAKYAYVTPSVMRALPEYREALLRALSDGTAERI